MEAMEERRAGGQSRRDQIHLWPTECPPDPSTRKC
jgi:hypothetical protein